MNKVGHVMSIDKVTQAVLLLTVYFNKREVGNFKPLTPLEYGRFASWLHSQELSPADLLVEPENHLDSWLDPKKKITAERIRALLGRGGSMAFALESWRNHGVWMLSRGAQEYPKNIRKLLGDSRPPILFGVGEKSLLNRRGIGFVGSRSIDESDAQFTKGMASSVTKQGYVVVSGGAKGIDQTAMEAALECGGESVGVLADSLLKASTRRSYREAIQEGRLVLLSPYYPESGFSVGNAMGRNKYIYTLSEAVIAVKSDFEKGGTWAGAVENQKNDWVPLLVRDIENKGNRALIERGAIPVSDDCHDIQALIHTALGKEPEDHCDAGVTEKDAGDLPVEYLETIGQLRKPSGGVEDQAASEASKSPECSDSEVKLVGAPSELATTDDSVAVDDEVAGVSLDPDKAHNHSLSMVDDTDTEKNSALERIKSDLKTTDLAQYGDLFAMFVSAVVDVANANGSVTSSNLVEKFPELPVSLVKKWLSELEKNAQIVREGRKLSYTLPEPDLFGGN